MLDKKEETLINENHTISGMIRTRIDQSDYDYGKWIAFSNAR